MSSKTFREQLEARWSFGNYLCVGLDADLRTVCNFFGRQLPERRTYDEGVPAYVYNERFPDALVQFNRDVIEATSYSVCAYKVNPSFYLAYGYPGMDAFERTIGLVPRDIPLIIDWKIGEVPHATAAYVEALKAWLSRPLAVTANPYVGPDALEALLRLGVHVFVLCRTSNGGAGRIQDLVLQSGQPLYLEVARQFFAIEQNERGSIGYVVGATAFPELAAVREQVGESLILVPAIGKQGGRFENVVRAGRGQGETPALVPSVSRSVIYAAQEPEEFPVAVRSAAYGMNLELRALLGASVPA